MKHTQRLIGLSFGWTVLAVVLLIVLVGPASNADTFVLTNGSSTATYDNANGFTDYTVNYQYNQRDLLTQQQFWYRIGSSGPESSIGSLTLVKNNLSDTKGPNNGLPDGYYDTINSVYTNASSKFSITLTSTLTGYASPSDARDSGLGSTIKIYNGSSSTLALHLFLYSDFNLGPSPTETVWFPNSTTVYQSNSVAFPDGANLQTVETPQSGPTPTVSEETGLSPSILDSLTDGSPTTLSGTNMLTGDATWAFEWDVNIGAGLSEQISLNNLLFVPEPSSLMLGLSGLLLLAVTLRRARRVG